MPLELQEATAEDALQICNIEELAYRDDPLTPIFFPGPFPGGNLDEAKAHRAKEKIGHLESDPTHKWMKVIDTETGELVAFCSFCVCKEAITPIKKRQWGPGCNVAVCEEWWGAMDAFREKHMGNRPHVFLDQLLTHPNYQKRGCGRMLVDAVLKVADQLSLPTYLTSTPYGHKLYVNCGFMDVGSKVFNQSKYGGESAQMMWYMERPVPV